MADFYLIRNEAYSGSVSWDVYSTDEGTKANNRYNELKNIGAKVSYLEVTTVTANTKEQKNKQKGN